MAEDIEEIPLAVFASESEFIILDLDLRLVSEHDSGRAASVALAKYVLEGRGPASIYRRTEKSWAIY